jgi:hypothetical protein
MQQDQHRRDDRVRQNLDMSALGLAALSARRGERKPGFNLVFDLSPAARGTNQSIAEDKRGHIEVTYLRDLRSTKVEYREERKRRGPRMHNVRDRGQDCGDDTHWSEGLAGPGAVGERQDGGDGEDGFHFVVDPVVSSIESSMM